MSVSEGSFGERFRLTLITNDPKLAADAELAGIDRIGVDLEHIGKAARQQGSGGRLSQHTWDDLSAVAETLTAAKLFVRLNPLHGGSAREVEAALDRGAELLMLPFFQSSEEVRNFVQTVRARASVIILLETAAAITRIRDILSVNGIDEVMIGLNDLRLQLGVANHFEVLASPLVDAIAAAVHAVGLPLGIGGLARFDDTELPVPPDLIYAQYPRLNASGAWIGRSYFSRLPPNWRLAEAILATRRRLTEWSTRTVADLERARDELARCAAEWDTEV